MVDTVIIFVPVECDEPGQGIFRKKVVYVTDANLEATREHVRREYGEKSSVWFPKEDVPVEVVEAIQEHDRWLREKDAKEQLDKEMEGLSLEEQCEYLKRTLEAMR